MHPHDPVIFYGALLSIVLGFVALGMTLVSIRKRRKEEEKRDNIYEHRKYENNEKTL